MLSYLFKWSYKDILALKVRLAIELCEEGISLHNEINSNE